MGKPLGDDLRRKLLFAYDQGEGTLEELASRFLVSVAWAKKISAARHRAGQAERVPHKPGRKPHAGIEAQQQVRVWFVHQPDLTLAEAVSYTHLDVYKRQVRLRAAEIFFAQPTLTRKRLASSSSVSSP